MINAMRMTHPRAIRAIAQIGISFEEVELELDGVV